MISLRKMNPGHVLTSVTVFGLSVVFAGAAFFPFMSNAVSADGSSDASVPSDGSRIYDSGTMVVDGYYGDNNDYICDGYLTDNVVSLAEGTNGYTLPDTTDINTNNDDKYLTNFHDNCVGRYGIPDDFGFQAYRMSDFGLKSPDSDIYYYIAEGTVAYSGDAFNIDWKIKAWHKDSADALGYDLPVTQVDIQREWDAGNIIEGTSWVREGIIFSNMAPRWASGNTDWDDWRTACLRSQEKWWLWHHRYDREQPCIGLLVKDQNGNELATEYYYTDTVADVPLFYEDTDYFNIPGFIDYYYNNFRINNTIYHDYLQDGHRSLRNYGVECQVWSGTGDDRQSSDPEIIWFGDIHNPSGKDVDGIPLIEFLSPVTPENNANDCTINSIVYCYDVSDDYPRAVGEAVSRDLEIPDTADESTADEQNDDSEAVDDESSGKHSKKDDTLSAGGIMVIAGAALSVISAVCIVIFLVKLAKRK